MNQYIELYNQAKSLVCKHSAEVMNDCREQALSSLQKQMFSQKKNEDYAHTDVEAILSPDFGLNLSRLDIPVNPYEVFRCDVPNLSTFLYFMVNDIFYTKEQPINKLPEGVFAGSLKEFAEKNPEIAAKYYNKQAGEKEDKTVALNTLFAQDGFVLYVPKNVIIEKPIQLINILRSDVDFMVNRRLLIIIEENAQAKLMVCDHAMDSVKFAATQVNELFVSDNAFFDFYELEENTTNTARIASTFLSQGASSNVMVSGITLTNGKTRNNYYVTFKGEGAENHLSGMAIVDGEQQVDNFTFIEHTPKRCTSKELFKYVLNDRAVGSFAGRILVNQGADKTEAYQSNRNLCATKEARMYTRPELEIYADDVKCSHGATVGQLDEQALFYMRARGISEAEARMLLMFAFTSDVIEQIRLEPLKDRLKLLVEKRFRGELAKCKGCGSCQ